MIFHNDAKAIRAGKTEVMYTFENFEGGKDAAGASSKNSRTNYHIKKMVWMGLKWSDSSPNRQPHTKIFIRWDDMIFAFAEAANHVVGPLDAAKYTSNGITLSAKDAIKYIRTRKTYDGASLWSTDPYLEEVAAAGENAFDALVKNEKRIETCFEGNRFYDLQRWSTTLTDMNKPVNGIKAIKNSTGPFSYSKMEVEKRNLISAYLPIPYEEMLRMSKLVQNDGWNGWK